MLLITQVNGGGCGEEPSVRRLSPMFLVVVAADLSMLDRPWAIGVRKVKSRSIYSLSCHHSFLFDIHVINSFPRAKTEKKKGGDSWCTKSWWAASLSRQERDAVVPDTRSTPLLFLSFMSAAHFFTARLMCVCYEIFNSCLKVLRCCFVASLVSLWPVAGSIISFSSYSSECDATDAILRRYRIKFLVRWIQSLEKEERSLPGL